MFRDVSYNSRHMTMRKKKSVFVGLSGGVDSSVAALLLKRDGFDVSGVFLRCFNVDGCAERDAEDARRVAGKLDIPFFVFNLEKEYKERVVAYMVEGYRSGITPNPDVECNREIKFGLFLDRAKALGADYIATGHYVRFGRGFRVHDMGKKGKTASRSKPYSLFAALDSTKDQSYFLWTLTQEQLSRSLFPIGSYRKTEVRNIARRAGLPTAEKKDSQGICFLGKIPIADFLARYMPDEEGNIMTVDGKKIGTHRGIHRITVGQRHISAPLHEKSAKGGDRKPYYVVSKDAETNTVVVAEGGEHPALWRKTVSLTSVHFIGGEPREAIRCHARIRYRQPLQKAGLIKRNRSWQLRFHDPVSSVAPGQSAVFYSEEQNKKGVQFRLLGGGIIAPEVAKRR